jgi:hypothetical protein
MCLEVVEIRTDSEKEKVDGFVIVSFLRLGPCPAHIVLHEGITLDKPSFTVLDVSLDRIILFKDFR